MLLFSFIFIMKDMKTFKPGVTNLFETASYFLCTDWWEGLLVWYTLLKKKIAQFTFNYFSIDIR